MKKILILVFMLMMVLPLSSAFADTPPEGRVNVLSGKVFTYGPTETKTSVFTDGDLSTSLAISFAGTTFNMSKAYNYSFSAPTNISGYATKLTANNYGYFARILLTKSDGTTVDVPNSNDVYKEFSVPNVVTVSVYNTANSGSAPTVSEVKLYIDTTVNTDEDKFFVNDLIYTVNSGTSIVLSWSPIQSSFLKQYNLYQDGILLGNTRTNSIAVSQLVPGQTYTFKIAPVDTLGKEFIGQTVTYKVPVPDTTPPAVPKNPKVTPDRYRATVTADPVLDSDLAGYHIYLNGNRVTSRPVSLPYDLTGLQLDTEYDLEIASIDTSANLSARSTKVTFRTLGLENEPAAVTTLTGTPFNGGATLSWSPVAAAKEYKIYKGDGTFIMKTTQTSAKIQRLKNGQVVTFYVIASNDIGDSPKSNVVEVKPDSTLAPDVSLGYSLKEVADGTSSWFNSYWLILAFSLSIPLSFYVSNRIKGLFVS